jgi:hypothetical protein
MVLPTSIRAQEADEPATNLATMRSLAKQIASRVAGSVRAEGRQDSASVVVHPRETAWYVQASLIEGMEETGLKVKTSGFAPVEVTFGIGDLSVQYLHPRKEGMLGPTIVDRRVSVNVSAIARNETSGDVLFSDDLVETHIDTVEMNQITDLETPTIEVTKGNIPSEGFFSNIAEPIIVLGAIAVAVFLLFHVRS